MENIFTQILSAILLSMFLIMILCLMAGAKPEPVIKAFLDLIGTIFMALLKLAENLVRFAWRTFLHGWCSSSERREPAPGPRRPRRPNPLRSSRRNS